MKKRILLSLAAVIAVAIGVIGVSAFEAHVINVTAKIENALSVPVESLDFGTVFPQEQINKNFDVSLSTSFIEESRVDDVNYIIRQKPKCGITTGNGTILVGPTTTGHPYLDAEDKLQIDCGPAPRQLAEGETWGPLPSLCEYLSKHKGEADANQTETTLNAFHQPWYFDGRELVWNEASGYLTKDGNDLSDTWVLDLKVPCFGGYCAQDWAKYVADINPNADPALYTQPITNEHKIFGCDIWVEVTGVSQNPLNQ